eukprot:CAMPEP_0117670380 /NCGR_PEP_ID=MMETSP0804-20121206/12713_1 /TAXON_ID=1074897 /ORGANISM="Tetraselmis astigmatica, Strain CCMP880" /LENGTH=61 /DNA_ID=CAMNT_0005478657 /DNA_START=647 /DNA_END=833 /DNA_ORIENTATION=+
MDSSSSVDFVALVLASASSLATEAALIPETTAANDVSSPSGSPDPGKLSGAAGLTVCETPV